MGVYIGLDVGSVSAKLAALAGPGDAEAFRKFREVTSHFRLVSGRSSNPSTASIVISDYCRHLGNPLQTVSDLLKGFSEFVPEARVSAIRVTGSGAHLVAKSLAAFTENEFKAIACAMGQLYPAVRTVFEMGGESSKYLRLERAVENDGHQAAGRFNSLGIADYSTSGECAAGTGSFLDQQATRLQYRVEDIGSIVAGAKCAARIAGRCSVFAKTDMVHAQQKGYATDEVLKGLCEAVARNFKSNIVRGKAVVPPVTFIGAVSQNAGVVQALADAFHLAPGELIVPDLYAWLGAIGAAFLEQGEIRNHPSSSIHISEAANVAGGASEIPSVHEALSLRNVLLLRDHPEASRTEPLPGKPGERIPAFMGIDVGSVSTNLAVLDDEGRLLHEIYLRTSGRPIEVVHEGLQEIEALLGSRIEIRGVGTTGSGRELIGELVGADTVNDEITAHKTGAMYVHETLLRNHVASQLPGPSGNGDFGGVDTIFEIGGQDSKFISIDRGVVVDFTMNEACAAGTGSFLEEQAERLGIQIKDEFARLALASQAPPRLGERCTVFMERDVTAAMHRGARVGDLAAGLAYSVALNYLNRVVRGRKIGNVIYFQGGTAYNDAVAAAFSMILGKRIIVPPHNGVIGAIGMALIARENYQARSCMRTTRWSCAVPPPSLSLDPLAEARSTFRGYDLSRTRFEMREFVCKACSNYCEMKEITVEGRKTYWGDKCSDKFRKRARTGRKPVIEDLLAFRDRVLREDYTEPSLESDSGRPRVGIPQAMYYYDRFPFWRTYLEGLGFEVVLSGPTDRYVAARGVELSVAEPCFPVQIAHGHVQALLDGDDGHRPVDFVLLPNVMDMEAPNKNVASQLCPWNQTLPYVVRAAPAFADRAEPFLAPTVFFRLGPAHVKKQLREYFAWLGVQPKVSNAAVDAAYAAQERFNKRLLEAGGQARSILERTGEPAVLLVGRPYNLYDRNGNCDIPRKLRDSYGINVLPMDFLPLDSQPVSDLHPNMYWSSGRRILAAGRFARNNPNLHIIYITNFKCGPDSFIKHFLREAVGSPFLVLQFDGHGNDAGYLTRCEAYLDSKGILRCYSDKQAA